MIRQIAGTLFNKSLTVACIAAALLLFPVPLYSQGSTVLPSLNYMRSVSSIGLGEQGVASRSAIEGMQFNPANLSYSKPLELSFFNYRYNTFLDHGLPFMSIATTFSIPDIGYFGIEYTNWDQGDWNISTPDYPEGIGSTFTVYERSVALAYARNIGQGYNAGIEARYARGCYGDISTDKLFFSAGINYDSRLFDRTFNAGFSLTNFGTPVVYLSDIQSDPPPSNLNLGFNYLPVENDHTSLALQVETTRPISGRGDDGTGKSSLSSLFSEWSDFPRDVILHTGIAFRWRQLDLGKGFSFGQEFAIGNSSAGVKSGLRNYFTHSASVTIGYNDYNLSAGYSSPWYDLRRYSSYFYNNIPPEMFQVSLSTSQSPFSGGNSTGNSAAGLKRIILLAGAGPSLRVGRYHEISDQYLGMHMDNSLSYYLESDFYFDDANALIARFSYNGIPMRYFWVGSSQLFFESTFETISLSSQYRYHPLDSFRPFFVEGGVGILRTNPVFETSPRYYYSTTVAAGTGACFEVASGLYVVPSIDFVMMLNRVSYQTPGIGGYDQFDLGLKFGYAFE
jgi:hypothetical protein